MEGWKMKTVGGRQEVSDRVIEALVVVKCVFDNQGGVARNSKIFGLF